jgi:hypothetical protein
MKIGESSLFVPGSKPPAPKTTLVEGILCIRQLEFQKNKWVGASLPLRVIVTY